MKQLLISLLALALAGCLAFVPDDTIVTGYDDVHDAPSFWVRTWEIAYRDEGINFAEMPTAFKQCTGNEAVKMSPPKLTEAVERLLPTKASVTTRRFYRWSGSLPLATRRPMA